MIQRCEVLRKGCLSFQDKKKKNRVTLIFRVDFYLVAPVDDFHAFVYRMLGFK